jgi:mono/diheme cytochrome c family protein
MKAAVVACLCAVLVVAVAGSSLAAPRPSKEKGSALVRRGEYLVTIGGCNDCHTPWKMGPNGPEQDLSRMLSGHPETVAVQAAAAPGSPPWGIAVTDTFTAWSGPWGVSFTANLTPDPETGLGKWTEQNFIETMRTGRHQGRGRQILPPMPWFNYGKMTDEDLKATFAYLRSIPPVKNRVPSPILREEGAPQQSASGAPGSTGSGAEGGSATGTGSGAGTGGSTGSERGGTSRGQ